jgi:metal-responsive CopG/Arc/MetJ family transcriptional regulator
MEKQVITVSFDKDLLERVEQYQKAKRISRSHAIREAILLLLNKKGY